METERLPQLTREIFGNVSLLSKILFYGASSASIGVLVWGVYCRRRLWNRGKPAVESIRWTAAAANLARYVLLQRRVAGSGLPSVAHALLFGGFLVLFVGTLLIGVEHVLATILGRPANDPVFHKGAYYAVYEIVLDTAGLAMLVGCAYFAYRRSKRPKHLGHDTRDWLVLALIAAIGVTGYLTEGLRIIREATPLPGISYVGYLVASLFHAVSLTPAAAAEGHAAMWWFHASISLFLIALIPYSRLLHAIAGAVRLAAGIERLGALPPVSLEEVEETGEIGAAHVEQFTRRQLVELDACVSCGRCEQACPAFEAGKPLSPRDVVQDIRRNLERTTQTNRIGTTGIWSSAPLISPEGIADETIWSCTTCSACVDVCPLGVSPLGFITELRRHLIADGRLHGSPATALQRSERSGNPWGLAAQDRMSWAAGLDVPTVADNPEFDVLYWIGCAAAYDRSLHAISRSVVKVLRAAKINFAVLGPLERCTGEAARRMGDELLFQQLALQNLATFERFGLHLGGKKRIVSHCPHCVNSFRLDYAQLGARLNVVHHSEFLADIVATGRLKVAPSQGSAEAVTYHDPCYLARVWQTTEAPREILKQSGGRNTLVEMARRGRNTACCGAGGGRMWFDDGVETRIGQSRVNEALATGATTLAVSCPFCRIMASDGVAARGGSMAVRDVAEILADSLTDGG